MTAMFGLKVSLTILLFSFVVMCLCLIIISGEPKDKFNGTRILGGMSIALGALAGAAALSFVLWELLP